MGRKIEFNPPNWLIVILAVIKKPIVWINVTGNIVNAVGDLHINPYVLLGLSLLRETIAEVLVIWQKQEISDDDK